MNTTKRSAAYTKGYKKGKLEGYDSGYKAGYQFGQQSDCNQTAPAPRAVDNIARYEAKTKVLYAMGQALQAMAMTVENFPQTER